MAYTCPDPLHGTRYIIMATPRGGDANIYTVPTCKKCGVTCGEGVKSPETEYSGDRSSTFGSGTIVPYIYAFLNRSRVANGVVEVLGGSSCDLNFTRYVTSAAQMIYDDKKMQPRVPLIPTSFAAAIIVSSILNPCVSIVFPADFAGFIGDTKDQRDELKRLQASQLSGDTMTPESTAVMQSIEAVKKNGAESESSLAKLINPHLTEVPPILRKYMNTFRCKSGKPLYDGLFASMIEKKVASPSMVIYLLSGMRLISRFFRYAYNGKSVDWTADMYQTQKDYLLYAIKFLLQEQKSRRVSSSTVRTRERRMWRHAGAMAFEFFICYIEAVHSVCANMSKVVNPNYKPDTPSSCVWQDIVNVPFHCIRKKWRDYHMVECTKTNHSAMLTVCKKRVRDLFVSGMKVHVDASFRGQATKKDLEALQAFLQPPPEPKPVSSQMVAIQPKRVQVYSGDLELEGPSRLMLVCEGEPLYAQALEVFTRNKIAKKKPEYLNVYHSMIALRVPEKPDASDDCKRRREDHLETVAEFRREEAKAREQLKHMTGCGAATLREKMQAMHAVRRRAATTSVSRKRKRKRSDAEQEREDDERDDEEMEKKADAMHAVKSTHERETLMQEVRRRPKKKARPCSYKSPAMRAMAMACRRDVKRRRKEVAKDGSGHDEEDDEEDVEVEEEVDEEEVDEEEVGDSEYQDHFDEDA